MDIVMFPHARLLVVARCSGAGRLVKSKNLIVEAELKQGIIDLVYCNAYLYR